jgi:chromate reductase
MNKIAVFVGSLRRESINLKFAHALEQLGKAEFIFQYVNLADVPMYNEDLWQEPPQSVVKMKADVFAADALLFVTPEYNRSLPAVLKNALDWGSRPQGKSCWAGKAASIVGTSPGSIGTAVAQAEFRSIAPILDLRLMGQPEVYFVFKPGLVTDDGHISDKGTQEFLVKYLQKFNSWITAQGSRLGLEPTR